LNDLEIIVDSCLKRMSASGSSVEECLALYPEREADLRPVLEAARRFDRARELEPSSQFRIRIRARVLRHAAIRGNTSTQARRPAWQLALASAALVIVMLAGTTAIAQAAFPGQTLYGWKLGSEHVWRAVSGDPVGVDLTLMDRRSAELTRVASDRDLQDQARDELHQVLGRLESVKDDKHKEKIDQALRGNQKQLSEAGIRDEQLDNLIQGKKPQNK